MLRSIVYGSCLVVGLLFIGVSIKEPTNNWMRDSSIRRGSHRVTGIHSDSTSIDSIASDGYFRGRVSAGSDSRTSIHSSASGVSVGGHHDAIPRRKGVNNKPRAWVQILFKSVHGWFGIVTPVVALLAATTLPFLEMETIADFAALAAGVLLLFGRSLAVYSWNHTMTRRWGSFFLALCGHCTDCRFVAMIGQVFYLCIILAGSYFAFIHREEEEESEKKDDKDVENQKDGDKPKADE